MQTTVPIGYKIHLAPDLEALTFTGRVDIEIELFKAGAPILLDSVGLDISRCTVVAGGVELESSTKVDEKTVKIICPGAGAGIITVSLAFNGLLRDNLVGFYDAPFEDSGVVKHLAVTQFEEDHARRAFPCFDHPKYNTPFSVSLEAPDGCIAISTTAIERSTPVEGGGTLNEFRTTPPMPTYLLFFGVGEFECLEDYESKVPIRVAATRGKAEQGRRAIEFAKASIAFCERFTGIEYPLEKLDLLALPAFAYGAMENFGAITFREHLLLSTPGVTSKRAIENIARITAHEVAHMWFGDITSPAAWRFVWLNEAFATYLQYLICDTSYPEWRPIDRFVNDGYASAVTRDSLIDTIPIELPSGCHMEIDASTAPIFYQKAGLILRMVHGWLGDEKFTAGVRAHLSAYLFQSTDTQGFLQAFAAGAGEEASGIIANWIRQPGYPGITLKRAGTTLTLTQNRFTWLANDSDQLWHIPVSLLLFDHNGKKTERGVILDKRSLSVDIPEDTFAVKANADHSGFFHTSYPSEELDRLGNLAREGTLGDRDRFGLVFDLYSSALRGDCTADEFVAFLLAYYKNERGFLPLSGIGFSLRGLWRHLPAAGRERVANAGLEIFEPVCEEIGIVPTEDEPYHNVLLRDEVLRSLLIYGSAAVIEKLIRRFERVLAGESVETDLLQFSLCAGAIAGSAAFGPLCRMIEDPEKPTDLKVRAYEALGWFQQPAELTRVLAYTDNSIEEQNRIYVYRGIAANPAADGLLFGWLEKNLPRVKAGHHYLSSVVLGAFIPVCDVEDESTLDSLLESLTDTPLSAVVSMAKEKRRVFRLLGKQTENL